MTKVRQPIESNRSRIEPHALKPSSVLMPAPCNVLSGTAGWPAVAPGEGTQRCCHLLLLKPVPDADTSNGWPAVAPGEGTQRCCHLLLLRPVPDADTSNNCFGFYKKEATAGLEPPVSMNFQKVLSKSEIGSFLTLMSFSYTRGPVSRTVVLGL